MTAERQSEPGYDGRGRSGEEVRAEEEGTFLLPTMRLRQGSLFERDFGEEQVALGMRNKTVDFGPSRNRRESPS